MVENNFEGLKSKYTIDNGKPNIALVIDTKNWAFANRASQIKKYLSDEFNFYIIPGAVIPQINKILYMSKKYDIVHFFWRNFANEIYNDSVRENFEQSTGLKYDDLLNYVSGTKFTTAICEHLFLEDEEIPKREKLFNEFVTSYYTNNDITYGIYCNIAEYKDPWGAIANGVDTSRFKPINIERFEYENIKEREITIGWVGNSKWGDAKSLEIDSKGVYTILNPAIEALQKEGYKISKLYVDKAANDVVPLEKMPEYYSKIDILVCSALTEGTPNPVLEAMSCGVPVISTNVGNVPEVFGEKQSEFKIYDRTVENFKQAIKKLYENRKLFKELSDENLNVIKDWDTSIKTEKFRYFFRDVLNK